jgi:hypothetical protein|tara:strand:+ start:759 stop:1244 length:486 start_codon:yes stop_codon:yes gene_type:complete
MSNSTIRLGRYDIELPAFFQTIGKHVTEKKVGYFLVGISLLAVILSIVLYTTQFSRQLSGSEYDSFNQLISFVLNGLLPEPGVTVLPFLQKNFVIKNQAGTQIVILNMYDTIENTIDESITTKYKKNADSPVFTVQNNKNQAFTISTSDDTKELTITPTIS